MNKFSHERLKQKLTIMSQKLPVIIEELVPDGARSWCRFNHIAEKEKEDTESHKINELYEFSNGSSRD